MTLLSEKERDSLVELINIAFGRAAASLSELTGRRVVLEVPRVSLCAIEDLESTFSGMISGEVVTVHQIFSGPVAGDALLMVDTEGARHLCSLLTDSGVLPPRLGESEREVLTEVGNILLNACLGTFSNMLDMSISFSVPWLKIEAVQALLESLVIESQELRYALVIATNFSLLHGSVGGYMILVLGVSSLERLLAAIEGLRW
ncbi:MAG: chemotaxis protein CheC [Thermoleophilia bacterium]|nr:chemotaxis protein CheC [Thermoleophilia bacterium]